MNRILNVLLPSGGRGFRFVAAWLLLLSLTSSTLVATESSVSSLKPVGREARRTLVVLGDSLAAGYGVDPTEAFPAVLQRQFEAAGLGFTVINAGVSGDTSAGALRRLDWILRRPVDVLLLEVGGNDGLRGQPPSALKANLHDIIERTRKKYPQARVVLAGMKMPPNMGSYAEQFEKVFLEVSREQNVLLIPFLLAGVGGVPALNLPDGIHPTPEGHRRVATNVFEVLKPMLHPPATPP